MWRVHVHVCECVCVRVLLSKRHVLKKTWVAGSLPICSLLALPPSNRASREKKANARIMHGTVLHVTQLFHTYVVAHIITCVTCRVIAVRNDNTKSICVQCRMGCERMASRTAGIVTVLFVLSFALLATGTHGSPPVSAKSVQAIDAGKMAEMKAHVQSKKQVCVF